MINRYGKYHYIFLLLLSFSITACSGIYDDFKNIRIFGGQSHSHNNNRTGGVVHVVKRGQTLYSISKIYGIPLKSIILRNNISAPYKLLVGQKITIPVARIHRVKKGESVSVLAQRYKVSMSEIVRINKIKPPYVIYIGQKIMIPASLVELSSYATLNRIKSEGRKKQKGKQKITTSFPQKKISPLKKKRLAKLGSEKFKLSSEGYPVPRARGNVPARSVAKISAPPAIAVGGFSWPVKGRVISKFGNKGNGLRNEGINIAAPRGTAVRAAQNGVVAYSGSQLQGFGKMILIRHASGYITAYAHNDTLLAKRGDIIKRGQTIARIGSSGNVKTPQLHFQLRKGKKTRDPLKYLKKG